MVSLRWISLILVIAACTVRVPSTGTTTALEGTWVPTCAGDDRLSMAFTGGSLVLTTTLYDGTGCSTVKAKLVYTNSFTLGGVVRAGEKKLDYTQVSALATLKTAGAVTEFNTATVCGYSDWALDQPKDVSGKTCGSDVQPTNGSTKYSIYTLDTTVTPNDLKVGISGGGNDGSSSALRHSTLGTNGLFKQ